MEETRQIFFGAGPGRCGTMTLANLLNAENLTLCTHEGKIRDHTESGRQWLPFLTMENYIAYSAPDKAYSIFQEKRTIIPDIMKSENLKYFGDIAYNNTPFLSIIPQLFPESKLIVMVRDGRDFVRSVYTSERPDPTPVGWLDEDTELTALEKYISFGRLRPHESHSLYHDWENFNPVQKNAWLWSETMRLIKDGLKTWSEEKVFLIRFESFFKNPKIEYQKLRKFLGYQSQMPEAVDDLLRNHINHRKEDYKILPRWHDWSEEHKAQFKALTTEMMEHWGYEF